MPAKHTNKDLGTGAKVFYAIVCLIGLVGLVGFIKTDTPYWFLLTIASLPSAERLHRNYFVRK